MAVLVCVFFHTQSSEVRFPHQTVSFFRFSLLHPVLNYSHQAYHLCGVFKDTHTHISHNSSCTPHAPPSPSDH